MDFKEITLHRTEDGWLTDDPRAFRILTEHEPIRPWGWWDQIRVDSRSHLVPWIWIRGILQTTVCSFVIAFVISIDLFFGCILVPLLWFAIKPLKAWRTMASDSIHNFRTKPLARGLVKEWKPHPIFFFLHIGEVKLLKGESVNVSISSQFLRAIQKGNQEFEVFMMYDPAWTCQTGFAMREP